MFIHATDLSQSGLAQADVCIVGAGAAGLSMAQRLAGSGLSIVLLESGGLVKTPDPAADGLNAGTSSLEDYPFQASRARGFGGTTSLWTGACVRLEADDFEPRDWVPYSGWPIRICDIEPYYREAEPLFGMVDPTGHLPRIQDAPLHGGGLMAGFAQLTQMPHFGVNHQALVAGAKDVTCILGATVTGFSMSGGGQHIDGVTITDTGGASHEVQARATVLATGGIEAPRLLLLAAPELHAAMGRSADAIGRYHMEHPIRSLGVIKVPDARNAVLGFTDVTPTDGADLQGMFGLSEDVRRKERLLNLHFRAYRFHALEDDAAIVRLKRVTSGGDRNLWSILRQFDPRAVAKSVRYGAWHLLNKSFRQAQFDHVRLLALVEQEPDPANRITLSQQRDRFGLPLPHLELTESARMKDSVARTLDAMGRALDERGLRDHRLGEAPHLSHYGGYGLHHMGGTRMSDDPAQGVVDANCCVHGMANLYIASSSVFTTGGAANPTLTIAALALRLSDHLKTTLLSP